MSHRSDHDARSTTATGRPGSALLRSLPGVRLLVAGLAGAAAGAVALVRRRQRRRAGGATPPSSGLRHLTDRELFGAWDHTATRLAEVSDSSRAASLVITRQYLLDEMSARYPRAWP